MSIRLIDFNRVEIYEAGALLVTLLAYPEESEEVRSQVHASLCAHALRVRCAVEPDWAIPPQPMKPIYALRRQDDNDRSLRTLERRVRDRMVAGRMAMGFLKEAVTGQIPAGIKRLSINEMALLVLNDVEYSEPENVETRILAPELASDPSSLGPSAPAPYHRPSNRADRARIAVTGTQRYRVADPYGGIPRSPSCAEPVSASSS
jgi:hypothetical protein